MSLNLPLKIDFDHQVEQQITTDKGGRNRVMSFLFLEVLVLSSVHFGDETRLVLQVPTNWSTMFQWSAESKRNCPRVLNGVSGTNKKHENGQFFPGWSFFFVGPTSIKFTDGVTCIQAPQTKTENRQ